MRPRVRGRRGAEALNLPLDTHIVARFGGSALFSLAALAAPFAGWENSGLVMAASAVVAAWGFSPLLRSRLRRGEDRTPMAENDLRKAGRPSPAVQKAMQDFDQKVVFQIGNASAPLPVAPHGRVYTLSLTFADGPQSEEITVLPADGARTVTSGGDPGEAIERCEVTNEGDCALSDLDFDLHLEAYSVIGESGGKFILGPRAHLKRWTLRFDLPAGRENSVVFHIRNPTPFAVVGVPSERAHARPVSIRDRINFRLVRLPGDRVFRWPSAPVS
jgi:hypothetical protein